MKRCRTNPLGSDPSDSLLEKYCDELINKALLNITQT